MSKKKISRKVGPTKVPPKLPSDEGKLKEMFSEMWDEYAGLRATVKRKREEAGLPELESQAKVKWARLSGIANKLGKSPRDLWKELGFTYSFTDEAEKKRKTRKEESDEEHFERGSEEGTYTHDRGEQVFPTDDLVDPGYELEGDEEDLYSTDEEVLFVESD